jgi:hypothetical protein
LFGVEKETGTDNALGTMVVPWRTVAIAVVRDVAEVKVILVR